MCADQVSIRPCTSGKQNIASPIRYRVGPTSTGGVSLWNSSALRNANPGLPIATTAPVKMNVFVIATTAVVAAMAPSEILKAASIGIKSHNKNHQRNKRDADL